MATEEQSTERGTVYVLINGRWASGDVSGSLLRDTGEVPWSHISSNGAWLTRDLTDGFPDRRAQLAQWYPKGYDVLIARQDGDVPAEVLERNALLYADEIATSEADTEAVSEATS